MEKKKRSQSRLFLQQSVPGIPAKVLKKMLVNRMVSSSKQSIKGVTRHTDRKDKETGDENVTSTVVSSTNTTSSPAAGSGTTRERPVKKAKTTQETSASVATAKPVKSLHALRKVLKMRNDKYLLPVESTSGTAGIGSKKVVSPIGAVSTPMSRGANGSTVDEETLPRMNGVKITVPAQVHVNGASPRSTAMGLQDGGALVKTQSGYKRIYSLNNVFRNEPIPGTSKDNSQTSKTSLTSAQKEQRKTNKSETTKKIKAKFSTEPTGKKSKRSTDSQSEATQNRGKKRKACTCVMCDCPHGSAKKQKSSNPDQNNDTEPSLLPEKSNTGNQTGKATSIIIVYRMKFYKSRWSCPIG